MGVGWQYGGEWAFEDRWARRKFWVVGGLFVSRPLRLRGRIVVGRSNCGSDEPVWGPFSPALLLDQHLHKFLSALLQLAKVLHYF